MELIVLDSENLLSYLGKILKIELLSFKTPWSLSAYIEQMELPFSHIWCFGEDQEVYSYCLFVTVLDELHLLKIATHPLMRRRGMASILMKEMLSYCLSNDINRIDLEVRFSNKEAIMFYEKHGFLRVGIRKGYYTKPKEDALLMTLFLNEKDVLNFDRIKRVKEG